MRTSSNPSPKTTRAPSTSSTPRRTARWWACTPWSGGRGNLNAHRPKSIPVLIYYLDALKALRAIRYANAIAEALDPLKDFTFTDDVVRPTGNAKLEEKARQAFEILVRDDLPAYIAHTWVQVVSVSIQRRITGTLAPHLREASEGLAEVFCLTDPSRVDNPIVFASEEFTRTTQYGMSYVIGRSGFPLSFCFMTPFACLRICLGTISQLFSLARRLVVSSETLAAQKQWEWRMLISFSFRLPLFARTENQR